MRPLTPRALAAALSLGLAAICLTPAAAHAQLVPLAEAEQTTGITASGEGEAYEPHKLLVSIPNGTAIDEVEELIRSSESIAPTSLGDVALVTCHIEDGVIYDSNGLDPVIELPVAPNVSVPQAIADIIRSNIVMSAEPNAYCELEGSKGRDGVQVLQEHLGLQSLMPQASATNDPDLSRQWMLTATKLPQAWALTRCNGSGDAAVGDSNVSVAVIDTGCTPEHEDLKDRIVAQYDAYNDYKGLQPVDTVMDPHSHGTHVCGIATASTNNGKGVAGASYNAGLVACKGFASELDEKGSPYGCNASVVLQALSYILNHHEELDIRVINMSLGSKITSANYNWNSTVYKRITALRNAGVLMVNSCGNKSVSDAPYAQQYSDYDGILSVINLDHTNTTYFRSNQSNYNVEGVTQTSPNQTKDIAAPGTNIWSTTTPANGNYQNKSGTSMASPLVAGIAALCFAEDPALTAAQVQTLLETTAVDLGDTGWDRDYGHGMIDAYAAVSHIMSNVDVAAIPDQLYTGSAVEPSLTLTNHDGTKLVAGTDYTVEFDNNVNAGTATATISGAGSYVGTATATFAIVEIPVTATNVTVPYDGQPHTPTITPNEAGVNIMYSADDGSTYTLSDLPSRETAGTTTVHFRATLGDQTAHGSATVTVNRKILSPVYELSDKEYDGLPSLGTSVYYEEGYVRGKFPSVSWDIPTEFPGTHVNSYTLSATATLADSGNSLNYAFHDSDGNEVTSVEVSATASITPRAITIESKGCTKTYDGTPLSSEEQYEWTRHYRSNTVVVNRELGGQGTESFEIKKTGGSQTQVGSRDDTFEYRGNDNLDLNDYDITIVYGKIAVVPAPLTVTSVTASDKTYDGTTGAAVTGVALAGAVGSERPTATAKAAFDTKDVGTNKTVTATGFALDAGNPVNANYELADTTATGTASILPAPLTVTSVAASDKTYDGTTGAAVTGVALAGAVGSERPTATATATFDTAAAGKGKAVTATGIALTDAAVNANYELADTNATTTASVLPRRVTLTSASASKAYDGKPLTARRVDVGGDGWATGEGAAYSYTGSQTAVGSSANAFTYALAANTLAANYDITTANGTLTVTAAPQAVMYRLYNPNSGEHFYTASRGERDALVAVGWTYEGRGWSAPTTGSPVYRLYNANAGDHHYTVSRGERDALVAVGWTYEGVGWNSGGTTPLWRQYNPNAVAGSHNYTPSASERDALVALGWKDEGIAWYGL